MRSIASVIVVIVALGVLDYASAGSAAQSHSTHRLKRGSASAGHHSHRHAKHKKHVKTPKKHIDKAVAQGSPSSSPPPASSPTSSTSPAGPTASCPQETAPVLPPTGPGPTALVGGIYVIGGPPCAGMGGPVPPVAGTVDVLNEAHETVATVTVAAGETFDIDVAPGTYTLAATLTDGGSCWSPSKPTVALAGQSTDAGIYCQVE
jgi:hypothetical protein